MGGVVILVSSEACCGLNSVCHDDCPWDCELSAEEVPLEPDDFELVNIDFFECLWEVGCESMLRFHESLPCS